MLSIVWVYHSLLTCWRVPLLKIAFKFLCRLVLKFMWMNSEDYAHWVHDKAMFTFGGNHGTDFQCGCILYSNTYPQPAARRVPRASNPLQHFFSSSAFSVILDLGHSKYSMGYHCCFNWQFLHGVWDQISFNCHLHLLWQGVCSSLCPFFKPLLFISYCCVVRVPGIFWVNLLAGTAMSSVNTFLWSVAHLLILWQCVSRSKSVNLRGIQCISYIFLRSCLWSK